ncbi:hypothetical protein GIB67_005649 [Kingdonia uniflora]|uniref:Serine hydrolase domain-containing protein n=1 Tax=Kingdonia uniflora TaxID=39325 RepID=A0A7J7NI68_9MAGN|nr:hypothetical protein GIB67_005649 [Kingdonia uniflora]
MGYEGKEEMIMVERRKPRVMCLHGFRTSGEIMKTQIGKWPKSVFDKLDLVFVDAPFASRGKSAVEGIFEPPYYEWFQFDNGTMEYWNFDECVEFIEECMVKHGPFDGLMGFSQGGILSAGLPGLQAKALALTKVPKIKFVIILAGAKFVVPTAADNAFSSPVDIPSLHFLGETDYIKPRGIKLLESFVGPIVIHHPQGHTVPRLDEKNLGILENFIEKIQGQISGNKPTSEKEENREKAQNTILLSEGIVSS